MTLQSTQHNAHFVQECCYRRVKEDAQEEQLYSQRAISRARNINCRFAGHLTEINDACRVGLNWPIIPADK